MTTESLSGTVRRRRVAAGSKSDHEAVVFDIGQSEPLLLRRRGGNAFKDPQLDALVGRRIEGLVARTATTFILDRWRTLD